MPLMRQTRKRPGGGPMARKRQPASAGRAEEMMKVALDLFAERNFASVTIKDIAEVLGVNTALLYYYFDSKDDLFRATIEHTVNQAFAHFRELRLRHTSPADILSDWLDNHVDLFDPIHKLVKISLDYSGTQARSPSIDRSIRQFYEEEARVLSDCIQEGIDSRIFRRVDPHQMAQFISGYLDGLMVRSVILPKFDLREAVEFFRAVLWENLGYPGARSAAKATRINRAVKN
jgi:AcrR family transcriptional regulator